MPFALVGRYYIKNLFNQYDTLVILKPFGLTVRSTGSVLLTAILFVYLLLTPVYSNCI